MSDIYRTIATLEDEAARLRRVAAAAEAQGASATDLTSLGLTLPPEVVAPCPGAVAAYLRAYPDLVPLVGEMAAALVDEFRSTRSEIELRALPGSRDRRPIFDLLCPPAPVR